MPFEFVDRAYVEIDGAEVSEIKSIDVTPTRDTKVIKTMTRRDRGRGFSKGVPHWELAFEVAIPKAGEYDWRQAFKDGTELTVVVEESSTRRFRYEPCIITEVGSKYQGEGGDASRSIKMLALDESEE
jgi:hypothetical protein